MKSEQSTPRALVTASGDKLSRVRWQPIDATHVQFKNNKQRLL